MVYMDVKEWIDYHWARFEESVRDCFGPSKYEDPLEALSKMLQLGASRSSRDIGKTTGMAFQAKFGALREELQVTRARVEDQSASTAVTTAKPVTNVGIQRLTTPCLGGSSTAVKTPNPPLLPTPNTYSKLLAIKWISLTECHKRLNRGLCFNCDNKWVRGHKCSGNFFLLMANDEDDAIQESKKDVIESGSVHVLIDNGSTHNYVRLDVMEKMYLPIQSTKALRGKSLRVKWVNLYHMQALLEADDVYGVYEVHNLSMVTKGITTSSEVAEFTSFEIEQLLARFNSLFYAPATLPPHRIIDHRTHFLPNTKPVNVRPYRYPYYQKGKMEKLVKEMMEQDYRALNEVIVKDKFPIPTANKMFDELGGAIIFTKLDLRA
nr:retrotransposon-related protein [Tanacetum cinerariifolium]